MTDLDDIPLVKYKDIFNTISVDNIRNIMKKINNNTHTGHLRAITLGFRHEPLRTENTRTVRSAYEKYELFDIKIIF